MLIGPLGVGHSALLSGFVSFGLGPLGLLGFGMRGTRFGGRRLSLSFALDLFADSGRHGVGRVTSRVQRPRGGYNPRMSVVLAGPLFAVLAGLLPMLLL